MKPLGHSADDLDTPKVASSTYQMTLAGVALPMRWHVAANLIAAASILILGHPVVALAGLASSCAFDAVHTRLIARWMRSAPGVEPPL